jgi:pimeloyl-ACP methyl ester carboxylesterase
MPDIQVDDIRVHYESAGTGKPLILIHSYPAHCEVWQPQIAAFSPHRRVIAYDVRGLGKTEAPTSAAAYSQERSIADLLGLLDVLKIPKADICGLSMGGNIALNFSIRHPDRVSSLIVTGTGAGTDDGSAFARVANGWADIAESQGMEAFGKALVVLPVFAEYADRGPEQYRRLWGLLTSHTAHGVAHTARQVLAKRPTISALVPHLKALPVTTLIMVGSEDTACLAAGEVMAANIPNVRHHVIPKTGHFSNLEEPETVNRLIADFLSSAR